MKTMRSVDYRIHCAGSISCPFCASMMIAPMHSEYSEKLIYHYWLCDDCVLLTRTGVDLGCLEPKRELRHANEAAHLNRM
jgi:C4-type Zn-finger protein